MDYILSLLPHYQLITIIIFILAFLIQIGYWIGYSSISKYRSRHRVPKGEQLPAVSIIIIVEDDMYYIENGLPLLLEQEHPQFEVVVVNDCGGVEIDDELELLAKAYKNLKFTTLKKDDKFNHSRKIPLLIGLKAAKYDNVIIADKGALPTNEKWLSYMCRGFSGAELVIGYTGFELQKGIANKLSRCSRLMTSVRYLKSAMGRKPYRGIYNNIGYTKSLFFNSRGYTNLSMTVGEDDLFIQKVAGKNNTEVIINPYATLRQTTVNRISWWWKEQRYYTYSFKFYNFGVKAKIFVELLSRFILFLTAATLGTISALGLVKIPYLWAGVVLLVIARELVLYITVGKIMKRLGEFKLRWSFLLYDLVAPIVEAALALSRRISPPKTLWIQNSK